MLPLPTKKGTFEGAFGTGFCATERHGSGFCGRWTLSRFCGILSILTANHQNTQTLAVSFAGLGGRLSRSLALISRSASPTSGCCDAFCSSAFSTIARVRARAHTYQSADGRDRSAVLLQTGCKISPLVPQERFRVSEERLPSAHTRAHTPLDGASRFTA